MAPRLIAVALGALALAAPAAAAETPIIDQAANAARGRSVDGGSNLWVVAVIAAIAAALGVGLFRRARRRITALREVKATAKEDLVALADDVSGLDTQVDRNPEAKAAYLRAIEAYQRADDAFDRARSPRDIAKVTSALGDARFEMETAKALVA